MLPACHAPAVGSDACVKPGAFMFPVYVVSLKYR